jgi:hypothetical protein
VATGGRFWRRGNMSAHFVPTVADTGAPTVAEITAGDELTQDLFGIDGLGFENQPIDVPDMSSQAKKQIPGEDDLQAGTLHIYEERTTNPLGAVLAKGTRGFLVIAPYKSSFPAATDKVEVWPVEVASSSRPTGTDATGAMRDFKVTVTDAPDQDAVVAS